jgi:hypothetical protein
MNVRLAQPKDKHAVLSLLSQLGTIIKNNHDVKYKRTNSFKYGSDSYDRIMKNDMVKIFVIEKEQTIVGLASYFIYTDMINGNNYAHIDDFIIEKSKRNHGYGTVLIQEIVKYSKMNNIKEIKLVSFPDVLDFYLKVGAKQSHIAMKIDV